MTLAFMKMSMMAGMRGAHLNSEYSARTDDPSFALNSTVLTVGFFFLTALVCDACVR